MNTTRLNDDRPAPQHDGFHPRVLAHLGDAVYELMVRELALRSLGDVQAEKIHRTSIKLACAEFQVTMLDLLLPGLNESEQALVKRARNSGVSISRRNRQKLYRDATAFEALVGHWHLRANTPRLDSLNELMREMALL